jgi:hypothetical protein
MNTSSGSNELNNSCNCYLVQATPQDSSVVSGLYRLEDSKRSIGNTDNPAPNGTLGYFGLSTLVEGQTEFPLSLIMMHYDSSMLTGIIPHSIRVFRWDEKSSSFYPIWHSGINEGHSFVWAKIRKPGKYVAIGLPRDPLLYDLLKELATKRRYEDIQSSPEEMNSLTNNVLKPFTVMSEEDLEKERTSQSCNKTISRPNQFYEYEIIRGNQGKILPPQLPRNESIKDFKSRILNLKTPGNGLPEEWLFYPPEMI